MKVHEEFPSIQGEGATAGVPTSFIRLQGCNLLCAWCDTEYARRFDADCLGSRIMSVDELLSNVEHQWVCITGGEPLEQVDELGSLVLALKARLKRIEIETNGSIVPPLWAFMDVDVYPEDEEGPLLALVDSWVVDVKLPSTGNPSTPEVIKQWADGMRFHDQLKFVASNAADLNEAEVWLATLHGCEALKLVSPVLDGSLSIEEQQPWLRHVAAFAMTHDIRYSLQIHKVLWGNRKGV